METKIINLCIDLLTARLTEDYEDIDQYADDPYTEPRDEEDREMFEIYRKEIKNLKTCIYALKAEKYPLEMGELVEIENGEAHVLGYWADNQNEYGPHPYRYTEICWFFMDYQELAKYIREEGNLADLEAEYTQYPQDGEEDTDEAALRRYLDDRDEFKAVAWKRFYSGKLKDGKYFVKFGKE